MAKMKFSVGQRVYYYGSANRKGTVHSCRNNGQSAGTNYGFSYQILEDNGNITDFQHELCLSTKKSN